MYQFHIHRFNHLWILYYTYDLQLVESTDEESADTEG